MRYSILVIFLALLLIACDKDESSTQTSESPRLNIELAFDETLPRLGNFGEEVGVSSGNAAQHPRINEVSLHYIEFAPDSLTLLGNGSIVYQGEETGQGGEMAVDFDAAPRAAQGEEFLSLELSTLPPSTYEWLRVSLTYQNYDIDYRLTIEPFIIDQDYEGTLASFVGFNTYIGSHTVADSTLIVNSNKEQGYWAFETGLEFAGQSYGSVSSGDGAGVTVVNPISATSPVPAGSCVVTGKLAEPLIITGDESQDVKVILAFSINNSFEWTEVEIDGKFEPGIGETVADMGLRGLHPYVLD